MQIKQATLQDVKGVMDRMQVLRNEVNETLTTHYRKSEGDIIPKSKFTDMKIGDKIYFNDSKDNYAELVSIGIDKMVMIVINEKGSTIEKHKHDFYEEMHLIKGKIWESVSDKIYVQHESIKIRPFQLHGFVAHECSLYTVVIKLL